MKSSNTALHLASLHRREDPFRELQASTRAGAVRQLALDHVVAQRPLGGIVRRRHQRVVNEGPQRRPDLDEVGAGVGRSGTSPLCASLLKLSPDTFLQPVVMPNILALIAPAEQQVAVAQQAPSDQAGQSGPSRDALEVAQQMGPTDLALLQRQMVVAGIAVADRHEAGRIAQQQASGHLAARRIDAKPHAPVTRQRPHPQRLPMALVPGLVGMAHRGMLKFSVQLRHRRRQGLADPSVCLRHRTQAEPDSHDVRQHRLHLALRQMELTGQRAHQCQSSRAELAAGHARGQGTVSLRPQPQQMPRTRTYSVTTGSMRGSSNTWCRIALSASTSTR